MESEDGRQIPAANATRWNRTLTMINSMIKIETEHSGVFLDAAEVVGSKVRLTAKDLATLKELQVLLQVFLKPPTSKNFQPPYLILINASTLY